MAAPRRRSSRILTACVGLLLVIVGAFSAFSYSLNGYRWPDGTQIVMHLQLTRATNGLQDGSASWNASAGDALNVWNQYIDTVQFVAGDPTSSSGNDGASEVLFSSTVYGSSWPTGVLAVTLKMSSQGSLFTETDVLFNDNLHWDSYRGPLQGSGPSGTYDFHRVALHEFGHVLGLDHPDTHGQTVTAQMNSVISDLDALASDDIAGAQFLYATRITSSLTPPNATAGTPYSYQITANNHPTRFSATGLPPGLQLDPSTGLISGTPTAGGTFMVSVVASGNGKDASGQVRIIVNGPTISDAAPPSADIDEPYSFVVIVSQPPSGFEATGLPAGLTISNGGLITGTPTTVGTFSVPVTAHTAVGDAVKTLSFVVQGPRLTSLSPNSVEVAGVFSYQVHFTGHPTSFGASGLPDGLQIDSATGVISGLPTLSGTYQVTVTANTPYGSASGKMTIVVKPPNAADPPIAQFPITFAIDSMIAADRYRPRVYVATSQDLLVIDTGSLSILKTIHLSLTPSDISISLDGSRLFAATKTKTLLIIDLDKLALLPSLTMAEPAAMVREGFNRHIFISDQSGGAAQINPDDGSLVTLFRPETNNNISYCTIDLTSDGKTLFVANLVVAGAVLVRYDVSGATPVRAQSVSIGSASGTAWLTVSPSGKTVSYGGAQTTGLYSTTDLALVTTLSLGGYGGQVGFSGDDSLAFESLRPQSISDLGSISVFSTQTAQRLRSISLPLEEWAVRAVVDRDSRYIFAFTRPYLGFGGPPALKVFSATPPPAPAIPAPRSLLNVSTRLRAQPGDNALIGGFIIEGNQGKQIALRGMGPSLPVQGKLADPVLELFDSAGSLVASNNNWNAHRYDVFTAGLAPSDEHEAVIITTLPPGAYTAVLRGMNDSSGVALVEAYDLSADSDSKLGNISTRGRVETGDNVMIGGFILGGDQTTTVVVRAIGPSLANFGVGDALADPTLEVYDGNGVLIAQDDDWRTYQEQPLIQTGLAPTDDRESAMVLLLQPGAYTAIVRGKNDTAGVGLVEVYNLETN